MPGNSKPGKKSRLQLEPDGNGVYCRRKKKTAAAALAVCVFFNALTTAIANAGEGKTVKQLSSLTLTVLYNNEPYAQRLETAWGMACLVEGLEQVILFDTGGDGDILLSNMEKLGKDPGAIKLIVLSHIHHDHIGGLWTLLMRNHKVKVYFPASFPKEFSARVRKLGACPIAVDKSAVVASGASIIGPLGDGLKEQALALDGPAGKVLITGCAHPGIVNFVRAVGVKDNTVDVVLGGFHLLSATDRQITKVIAELKKLGVQKVGPSHCSGDSAIRYFRQAWPDGFLETGCGAVIRLDDRKSE